MIVNYGDFTFVKDEGFLALACVSESGESTILRRVHIGDSLADLVGSAWTHRDAPTEVTEKAVGR